MIHKNSEAPQRIPCKGFAGIRAACSDWTESRFWLTFSGIALHQILH